MAGGPWRRRRSPAGVHLDQTGEALGSMLRPGNPGSDTAQDHLTEVNEARAQLLRPTRQHDPELGLDVLVRSDSAEVSHGFVDASMSQALEFSVGSDLTEAVREVILELPAEGWVPAITKETAEREGAEVVESTSLLGLAKWPEGSRVLVGREQPHPGANYNLWSQH